MSYAFCLICCCSACGIIAGTILTRCINCSDGLFSGNAVTCISIHIQQEVSIAYCSVFLLNRNYVYPWKLLGFFWSDSEVGAVLMANRSVAFDWLRLNKLSRRHLLSTHTRFMCKNKYLLHVGRGLHQPGQTISVACWSWVISVGPNNICCMLVVSYISRAKQYLLHVGRGLPQSGQTISVACWSWVTSVGLNNICCVLVVGYLSRAKQYLLHVGRELHQSS